MNAQPARIVTGVVGAALALVLVSCSSLPLSATADQSLVVFPLHAQPLTKGEGAVTLAVTLVLVRELDGREIVVPISLRKSYASVALEPGAYLCNRIEIRRGWRNPSGGIGNNWVDRQNLSRGLAFYVVPRIVRLQESILFYNDNQFGDGYSCYLGTAIAQTAQDKERLLGELKKDAHWAGWEGYQLVNFAVE